MTFLSEFRERVDAVASVAPVEVAVVSAMRDDDVVALLAVANELAGVADRVRSVAAGVIAARSPREAGHRGLAQGRGHRNAVALVQELSGSTRGEAARQVRVGQSLVETAAQGTGAPDSTRGHGAADAPGGAGFETAVRDERPVPWHEPLDRALLRGVLTSAQMDAILRGLGEPPAGARDTASDADAATAGAEHGTGSIGAGAETAASAVAVEAWRLAAEQLVGVAGERAVEELAGAARVLRDRLDPEGAEARFLARHAARSWRMWTDADGVHHAKVVFDDEGAAWVRSMIDAALRPRRGGPRFVDAGEAARAEDLARDPRSNEQLSYDLILDTLRAGAIADAETVFGARQPGVRVVTVIDTNRGARGTASDGPDATHAPGTEPDTGTGSDIKTKVTATEPRSGLGAGIRAGYTEDGGYPLPGPAIEHAICTTGYTPITVDGRGNPLDVGRQQRLFTPKQRIALAIRDGGCRWRGCTMPASYTEAHHIDEWAAHGGRTDIDRGILLCRFHHMNLHHHRYRITRRDRHGPFLLHPPDGTDPTPLPSRSPLRWMWDPPPRAA